MISGLKTIFDNSLRKAQPLACRLFEAAVTKGRLANAYLLDGRSLQDKWALSLQLACFLNCSHPEKDLYGSCLAAGMDEAGYCLDCRWISRKEHPQAWLELSGEGRTQKLPVEKVRLLTEELAKTSGFMRVVLIPDAGQDSFHRPAANALLKDMEEPPDNCLFILFSDSAEDVLATVVSRCQVVPFCRPLALGYWQQPLSRWQSDRASQGQELLAEAKSDFLSSARRQMGGEGSPGSSFLSYVGRSRLLFDELQKYCRQFEELLPSEFHVGDILDLVVASDLELLRERAVDSAGTTDYLSRLLALGEGARQQIDHFVKPVNVLESFCFALSELRYQYSGEISLAKR